MKNNLSGMFQKIKNKVREVATRCLFYLIGRGKEEYSLAPDSQYEKYNLTEIGFHISSSPTYILPSDSGKKYFHECRLHTRRREYVIDAVSDFFFLLCSSSHNREWKEAVLNDLASKENYKKFIKCGNIYNANVRAFRSKRFSNYKILGIPSLQNMGFEDHLPRFIKYMRGVLGDYNTNSEVGEGKYHMFNANRKLATREFSILLGIENLIPEVHISTIVIDGKQKIGTLMVQGGDVSPCALSVEERSNIKVDTFLRDITNLEIFDFLCYQLDHRLGNYNIVYGEEKNIIGVSAFDNDAYKTFFINPLIPKATYCGCESFIDAKGFFNRPFIDKHLADRIFSITKNEIYCALSPYLSTMQLWALWKRIKQVRKALRSSVENNKLKLITDWETANFHDLLGEVYGMNYFKYYYTVDEISISIKNLGEEK